jgi:hypothetical protein
MLFISWRDEYIRLNTSTNRIYLALRPHPSKDPHFFRVKKSEIILFNFELRRLECDSSDSSGWGFNSTRNNQKSSEHDWSATIYKENNNSPIRVGGVALDRPLRTILERGSYSMLIWCMLLLVRTKHLEVQFTGLVLLPTNEKENEFRGIGLLYLERQDWFCGRERTLLDRGDSRNQYWRTFDDWKELFRTLTIA